MKSSNRRFLSLDQEIKVEHTDLWLVGSLHQDIKATAQSYIILDLLVYMWLCSHHYHYIGVLS